MRLNIQLMILINFRFLIINVFKFVVRKRSLAENMEVLQYSFTIILYKGYQKSQLRALRLLF